MKNLKRQKTPHESLDEEESKHSAASNEEANCEQNNNENDDECEEDDEDDNEDDKSQDNAKEGTTEDDSNEVEFIDPRQSTRVPKKCNNGILNHGEGKRKIEHTKMNKHIKDVNKEVERMNCS